MVWLRSFELPQIWADAYNIIANSQSYPDIYAAIYNTPTNYPKPGDVIVWKAGWGGSSVGHTALVLSADRNSFTVFEQNNRIGGGNGSCRTWYFPNYSGVLGWVHPRAFDALLQEPAPAPVQSPELEAPAPPATPAPEVSNQPAPEPTPAPPVQIPVQVVPTPSVPTPVDAPEPAHTTDSADQKDETPLTPPISNPHTVGMKDIILSKLLSRKLWLAVAGAVYFALNGESVQATAVILGYLGVEGFVDSTRSK